MLISTNKVVTLHYTLTDTNGTILDSSASGQPLTYIHGMGHLIAGMEEGLEGKISGDKLQITVSPEKGYGKHNPELVQHVPLDAFGSQMVSPGMQFEAGNDGQRFLVTVKEVQKDTVIVDANHPLAGTELHFDVEVLSVREATVEELDHGHVHGPGGHQH